MPAPGTPPTYAAGLPSGAVPRYSSAGGPLPAERLSAVDARAMDRLILASALGLVGTVATYIIPYVFGYSVFRLSVSTSGFSNSNDVYGLIGTAAVATAFTCLQFWFFREAFHSLAHDDAGLKTPATLTPLGILGALILAASAVWILTQANQWLACAGTVRPIPTHCINAPLLLGASGILAVGAILALIGLIALWIGLWRLGTRYNESMFKIGMVLTIFPVLDIAGFILLILAGREVRARVPSAPSLRAG